MKIKSFFSHTIEDAISRARQEWGPEAMLVDTRRAGPESRHLGAYEVVFADGAPRSEATRSASPPGEGVAGVAADRFAAEVAALKKQLENMRRTLITPAFVAGSWVGQVPVFSEAYARLTAGDVSPELAREVVESAASRIGALERGSRPPEGRAWQLAVMDELRSRCPIESTLGTGDKRPRIVALVGPPGAGKTTTLIKLAVNYGLACRRPTLLISMDTDRVAAADQLRLYAAILGVGFHVPETIAALAQVIEENRGKDLILIDTPGLGFRDLEDQPDLSRFLATRSDIDSHLVLSSSVKPADLTRVIDSYEIFRPRHLLFTRLDETGSLGPLINEAARTGKPLSFLGTGQRIPEDLEAATHARLFEPLLGCFAEEARSVA
jgi:flagellar biosynthesis protein FlhF